MSFRFWRRIRIAPGVTVNLSKSTASLSFGPRGAKYTISPKGNRATVGLPGTGLFYTVHDRQRRASEEAPPAPRIPQRDRLSLSFFQRLVTPSAEKRFIDGVRALHAQDLDGALVALEEALTLPDAAWMAGMLRLKREDFDAATMHFQRVLDQIDTLGTLFSKYALATQVSLPITPEIFAHLTPHERSTRLALVEIAQLQNQHAQANIQIQRLMEIDPQDPVILLSFAEMALDHPDDRAMMDRVVRSTVHVQNETPVDTAILLYRGKALAALGMLGAAIDVLTLATRRQKDRPEALLFQIRLDRAILYERVGRKTQAKSEFERLYAENPDSADLRARLNL